MKSYRQYCGVAKALDVLGGRWTLLLVRDLLLGPRRYGDLLESHPGLATNLLASRLKLLQAEGVIEQRTLPPPAGSTVYALTERGEQLEDVILGLGRFGQQDMGAPGDDRVDVRWFAVSMRRRFRSSSPPFTAQLWSGDVPIHVRWDGERLHSRDGVHPADVTVRGAQVPPVLMGLATRSSVEVTGSEAVLDALIDGLADKAGD